MPQIHQVLPRVARLMASLRVTLFGPGREETSFLFIVNGKARQGMGLHHDGEVDSVWVQLEGRRTVTTGPQVPRGARADLDEARMIGRGWTEQDFATLLLMQAKASGIELKSENKEVGDGLSS